MHGHKLSQWVCGVGVSLSLAACADRSDSQQTVGTGARAIVNGLETRDQAAVGSLVFQGNELCTGTLIGCSTVLTAAHCVDSFPVDQMTVYFQHGGIYEVSEAIKPSEYSADTWPKADIAILKLKSPVIGIQPARFSDADADQVLGSLGTIIGFGRTGGNNFAGGVKRVGTVMTSACPNDLPANSANADLVCASFEEPVGDPGTDSNTCHGDSGGPMFLDFGSGPVVAGVASGTSKPGGGELDCLPHSVNYHQDVFEYRDFVIQNLGTDSTSVCGADVTGPNGASWAFDFAVSPSGLDAGVAPSELDGAVISGDAGVSGGMDPFQGTFVVADKATEVRVNGNAEGGGTLYVKEGSGASESNYSCRAELPFASCRMKFTRPHAGNTWSFMVVPSGEGSYQVTASALFNTAAKTPVRAERVHFTSQSDYAWIRTHASYTNPVVVCTQTMVSVADPSSVVRLRNAGPDGFEAAVITADAANAAVAGVPVECLVVEKGTYTVADHGVALEASKFKSTRTDKKGSMVGQKRTFTQAYTNPVVLGQVMTANDSRWSAFWARGSSAQNPPSRGYLYAGKQVGRDPIGTRADETLGIIVLEKGAVSFGEVSGVATLGPDTIGGIADAPPYAYTLSGLNTGFGAVASAAGMDGGDGFIPTLFGASPVAGSSVNLAAVEDGFGPDRNHTTEQAAVLATRARRELEPNNDSGNADFLADSLGYDLVLGTAAADADVFAVRIPAGTPTDLTVKILSPGQMPGTTCSGDLGLVIVTPWGPSWPGVDGCPTVHLSYAPEGNYHFVVQKTDPSMPDVDYALFSELFTCGCSDHDACNGEEVCNEDKSCSQLPPPDCTVWGDGVCIVGACDPSAGCYPAPVAEGTPCDDFNSCTQGTACNPFGACEGGTNLCTAIPAEIISTVSASTWKTLSLSNSYTAAVPVCTPRVEAGMPPVVVRVRNVGSSSFDVSAVKADGTNGRLPNVTIHCFVVEAGQYTVEANGMKFEAVRFNSTRTDGETRGYVGASRSYLNTYTQPVVLAQVITANDAKWSVAWARGAAAGEAPSETSLFVGKHVGEDPALSRANETVGYVVFEAGVWMIGKSMVHAGLAQVAGTTAPVTPVWSGLRDMVGAVGTMAGIVGTDGAWPVVYGPDPIRMPEVSLAVDEDNARDSERDHVSETIAFLTLSATECPIVCGDGLGCNGEELCSPGLGCIAGQPVDCGGFGCVQGSCVEDPFGWFCQYDPRPSGTACDDFNGCTGSDLCDASGNCVGTPTPGVVCDDFNMCTGSDVCDSSGFCQGTPVPAGSACEDYNPCTSSACGPNGACETAPLPQGTPCDDGNVCTVGDMCDGFGSCVWEPAPENTPCDDLWECTQNDHCFPGGYCSGDFVCF